jgi:sugar/nucleoside kinase (ribokinase family)
MAILVVGSVALDTIQTPACIRKNVLGGSATYFSLAAHFFHPVRIVAVVGSDMPKNRFASLKTKNIDLNGLEVKDGKTFRWHGKYESDMNVRNTLNLELNVFKDFIPRIPSSYADSKYVFLANIDPCLQGNVLKRFKSLNITALDTIDHWIKNEPDALLGLLKKTDIFFVNDYEARLFSQCSNLNLAAKWIKARGPLAVVIKKGEHGVLMFYKEKFFICPGYPIDKIVDPTGAGDAFAGGFMGYLASCGRFDDMALRQAIIYGSSLGSFTVEAFGIEKLVKLNKADILKRVREFKKITHFEFK